MNQTILQAFRWVVMIPASVTIAVFTSALLAKISFLPDWVSMSILGAALVVPAQLIAPSGKWIVGTIAAWVVVGLAVVLIIYRATNGPELNFFGWLSYLWGVLLLSVAGFLFRLERGSTSGR